jgi:hypothetical protein
MTRVKGWLLFSKSELRHTSGNKEVKVNTESSPTLLPKRGSQSAIIALDPSHLHLNQSLTFALSLDFHPEPSEPMLQCAQRQIMLLTKFTPLQPTGFEIPPSDV